MASRVFLHQLAAVGEGMCPDHAVTLEPQDHGGWCPSCRSWWWIDYHTQHIVQTREVII